jgi:hypothetical protein
MLEVTNSTLPRISPFGSMAGTNRGAALVVSFSNRVITSLSNALDSPIFVQFLSRVSTTQ